MAVPPSSVVSLSEVSVPRGQPRSDNIKGKIPEIDDSDVLRHVPF